MKAIIGFALMLSGALACAAVVDCEKGSDRLRFSLGHHMGNGPTAYGLRLNKLSGSEGYQTFSKILSDSNKCVDLIQYAQVRRSEILLCEGEMFATKGVYGQIILTTGALETFKTVLAPASGWTCK